MKWIWEVIRAWAATWPRGAHRSRPPDDSYEHAPNWQRLEFHPSNAISLAPPRSLRIFALLSLVPIAAWQAYLVLPLPLRQQLDRLSLSFFLLALVGTVGFSGSLMAYRVWRQRQQLQMNGALLETPPKDFVLYLRSFRRTGTVVTPNHTKSFSARHLLGSFWDIELALSFALSPQLPVVAVGGTSTSLGAAKLQATDASWQPLVYDLARRARAIVIAPDDRPGTIWELRHVLQNEKLRAKTLLVMPPEQFGWMRRLQKLPSIRISWARVLSALSPNLNLPNYDAQGALCLYRNGKWIKYNFCDFSPFAVREAIAKAITTDATDESTNQMSPMQNEDWIDPVLPFTLAAYSILGHFSPSGLLAKEPFLGFGATILVCNLTSLILYTRRYSAPSWTRQRRWFSKLQVHRWMGLHRIPAVPRAAIDTSIVVVLVLLLRSFIYEPFRVSSVVMAPNLLPGDLIFVSKFEYGIRLPFGRQNAFTNRAVQRGDVVVFRAPAEAGDEGVLIMRAVGIPGDEVAYLNQQLFINGHPVAMRPNGTLNNEQVIARKYPLFLEQLGENEYQILVDPNYKPPFRQEVGLASWWSGEFCDRTDSGVRCKVPIGHYYVLGDHRDVDARTELTRAARSILTHP